MQCSIRENAKAYKYRKKCLGCISIRAKLGIALSVIAAETFPLHLRRIVGSILLIFHKSVYLHHYKLSTVEFMEKI